MILNSIPDGVMKGDDNSRKKNSNAILSCVFPEIKDIPIEKQVWFKILQERKLPATHIRDRRIPHRKSHRNIGFVNISQAIIVEAVEPRVGR